MDYELFSAAPVLEMLIPNGGWACSGVEFENIQFLECEPITKEQYEKGLKDYPKWKAAQEKKASDTKSALLTKLGITQDEAKLLLS